MTEITFEGNVFSTQESETVLECLERHGVEVANSCRMGMCQACVVKAVDGQPTEESQCGLKPSEIEQGIFMSCCCVPSENLEIARIAKVNIIQAQIIEKEMLNERILMLKFKMHDPLDFKAGQFVNFIRRDKLSRSYSIASIPEDGFLEFHIRIYEDGKMTSWLMNELELGDNLFMEGPLGSCFYTDENPEQEILLAGIGTGLAPLYGILRDALNKGHAGNISLVQGALQAGDLYYKNELVKLAADHKNFIYLPSAAEANGDESVFEGKIDSLIEEKFKSLRNYRVFICGSPNTVKRLRQYSLLAGASIDDIYADPFIIS